MDKFFDFIQTSGNGSAKLGMDNNGELPKIVNPTNQSQQFINATNSVTGIMNAFRNSVALPDATKVTPIKIRSVRTLD